MSIENSNNSPDRKQSIEQWFEEEFQKREILDVPDGQVEVIDIAPLEAKHETPVILISGYGDGSPEARKANMLEIVKQGRRAIMVKSPHGINSESGDEKVEDVPESIMRQINAIVPALEQKGIEKVSAFGESRGGIVAAMAAYLHPDRFENLVLIDPGGMTRKTGAASLTLRFIKAGLSEGVTFKRRDKKGSVSQLAKEQVEWGTKKFAKWILKDPTLSAREINDIAKSEIYQLLKYIKNDGVGISIIHGVDDTVFPMKDVQDTVGKQIRQTKDGTTEAVAAAVPREYEKIVDGFYSVRGGHGEFNTQPELYTRIAEGALTALEEKKKKKADPS